jgi:DNA repair protein RadC
MLNHSKSAISTWAEEDRPREKLRLKGRSSLSDSEILAILMRSGSQSQSAVELARSVLSHFDNDLNKLARASVEELMQFKGIGEAKAVSIVSALELGRRRTRTVKEEKVIVINSADKVYDYFRPVLSDLSHEEFWILLLDNSLRPIRHVRVGQGGIAMVTADVRVIFKIALEATATAIILVHNHPSGKLQPSNADISFTEKVKKAAEFLDITIADHLIFTDRGYYSFSDNGCL